MNCVLFLLLIRLLEAEGRLVAQGRCNGIAGPLASVRVENVNATTAHH